MGVLEVNDNTFIQAQLSLITRKLNAMESNYGTKAALSYGVCQGDHHMDVCPMVMKNVSYVNNFQRQGFQQAPRSWGQAPPPQQQQPYRGSQ